MDWENNGGKIIFLGVFLLLEYAKKGENIAELQVGVEVMRKHLLFTNPRCELTRFVAFVTDSTFVNAKRFQMFAEMEMSSANR